MRIPGDQETPPSRQVRRKAARSASKAASAGAGTPVVHPDAPEGGLPGAEAFRAAGYNLVAATRGYVEIAVETIPEPQRGAVVKLLRASEGEWRYQQVFLRPDGSYALMGASVEDFAADPPEAILDGENMREYGIAEATYWEAMKWAMTDARKKAATRGEYPTLSALREVARDAVRAAAEENRAALPQA